MSELKDLAWSVQEVVEPPVFEQLERRGVRRRHRKQLVVAATVAAAMVAAVLFAVLPSGSSPSPDRPVAPPTAPFAWNNVASPALVSPTRWAAGWDDCSTPPVCRYAAVVNRDGKKATAPVRSVPYATFRSGDEVIAVSGPEGERLTPGDQSWSRTVLLRSTSRGVVQTALRYAAPTRTIRAGEILTDQILGGRLVVLNPADSTLRPFEIPGLQTAWSTARDETGRWWVVGGVLGEEFGGTPGSASRSDIYWSDDDGKNWQQALLHPDQPGSTLSVSPDGRTIVAVSANAEEIATVRMSTDRGAHWATVQTPQWSKGVYPVAFDDGTAVALGQPADHPTPELYTLSDGHARLVNGVPDLLTYLAGDEQLMYGPQDQNGVATRAAVSTDRGKTWSFVGLR
ncbi:hypothetical protein E0H73_08070 [Kribbella pittospori]|uniref:Exo-alpha-sialidase n=1 Tax=Kribbella pittospori TaxID=722689 RepID=A0A4R0L6I6_9ACTN|nr:hypothetical protein [Kribbella pittospori]TCC64355.1 hypothetical protein E0H73_08070 [Kribbella pittospori]